MAGTEVAGRKKPGWLVSSPYNAVFQNEDLMQIHDLQPKVIPKGTVIFRPGETPPGFVLVLSGRVGVFLIGKAGRELLLYTVEPGETCVQTTLGLMGDNHYSGEAVAETDCSIIILPRERFFALMDRSAEFRRFMFMAFGERLAEVTHMLETVAFEAIGSRLARVLQERAKPEGLVEQTHQELATAIGSSREVVSRQLERMQHEGIVELDRGTVKIVNPARIAGLVR
jgi:CRP/FNR family transcriptional regulator